jgi:phosphinothricin acetyltransferase
MSEVIVRPSTGADVVFIAGIYAHHVLKGTATFEIDAPDVEEIARRRDGVLREGLPYIVAECDGRVIGYAYAGSYRPRPAYRHTVEDSIYLHPDHTGKGIGRRLLSELLRQCELGPWRQMIAVIGDSANLASIQLHLNAGFRHAGLFQSVGWKFGRWLDTVLMQRPLGCGDQSPAGTPEA